VAKSLARFEDSTGPKGVSPLPPRTGGRVQAAARGRGERADGRAAEQATILATLRDLRTFFFWLAHLPGFKSHVAYADADYFNLSDKDVAVARARRDKAVPTLAQVEHVLSVMPGDTIVQRRDRALIAFLILTGTRVTALTSLRLRMSRWAKAMSIRMRGPFAPNSPRRSAPISCP
jgi:site-specific recombinase XerD